MTFIWRGLGSCTNAFMAHNAPPVTIVAVNSGKLFQRSSPPCAARTRASNSFTFFSFTRRWSTKAGGANWRPTLPYNETHLVCLELTHPVPGSGRGAGETGSQRLACGLKRIPVRDIRQRWNGGEFALIKTRERSIDHVLARHNDLFRQILNRRSGNVPEFGCGGTRQYDLHAHALVGEFVPKRLTEGEHERFASAINAIQHFRRDGDDRRDIDDRSFAARNKIGSSRINKPCQHAHIERYHVVHLRDVRAKQRCCRSHARIIDQHRNTSVGLQPFLNLFKVGFSGKIRGDDLDRPARLALQSLRESLKTVLIAGDQNQIVAAPRQAVSVDRADAGRRASDQGGPLVLVGHEMFLSECSHCHQIYSCLRASQMPDTPPFRPRRVRCAALDL